MDISLYTEVRDRNAHSVVNIAIYLRLYARVMLRGIRRIQGSKKELRIFYFKSLEKIWMCSISAADEGCYLDE